MIDDGPRQDAYMDFKESRLYAVDIIPLLSNDSYRSYGGYESGSSRRYGFASLQTFITGK
jgi:hypothetical protein